MKEEEGTTANDSTSATQSSMKIETSLDVTDLGAGYNVEDKRVARAINVYETSLLPFIKENSSIFKNSNFLAIKGYGSGLGSKNTGHNTRNSL